LDYTCLQLDHAGDSAMDDLIGHSITYRIALGPDAEGHWSRHNLKRFHF
jgi:hypothetical protein